MPWSEVSVMDAKTQFAVTADKQLVDFSELCRHYDISRKTGYKLYNRYLEEGPEGLKDRSRAPKSIPHKTPQKVVNYLVKVKKRHPFWGARKLFQHAEVFAPDLEIPSETTIGNILVREGLTRRKHKRRKPGHPGKPVTVAKEPNDIWTGDYKGEFKTRDGYYCYPLTILDEYSRFLFECQGLYSTGYDGAFKTYTRTFNEYGLPKGIKSDNGIPFATTGLGRLSKLSVWWIKLGINPILIEPGKPYQNGVHERMHRTLKEEATIPPRGNLSAQQCKFNSWKNEYNFERPHDALGGELPGAVYRYSDRAYPSKIPEVTYPDHFEVRIVSRNNCIRFHDKAIHVSSTLVREYVGLEQVYDGIWAVYFSWKRLGFFDQRKGKILDEFGRFLRR